MITLLTEATQLYPHQHCQIKLTSTWVPLETSQKITAKFHETDVHVGNIIIRKKVPETVKMKRIVLKLNRKLLHKFGYKNSNIKSALYKSTYGKKFYPTEEFIVSDGTWDKQQQFLIFEFDEELYVDAFNEFYIILTVPQKDEQAIQNNIFEISKKALPFIFAQ